MVYGRKSLLVGLCAIITGMNPVAYAADGTEDVNKSNGWELKTSLAYDSNIYRAPSNPYFDELAGAAVSPNVQSGLFIPLRAKGDFAHDSGPDNTITGSVRLLKDLYLDSDYRNADNTRVTFSLGNEHVFAQEKRRKKALYVGFKYRNNIDSYLDRDTGDEKLSLSGTDISKRYRYTQTGLEFEYKSRINQPQYKVDVEYFDRKYEQTVVKEYDYSYFNVGGEMKFRLAKSTKLGLSYHYYTIDYSQRSARSAVTGGLVAGTTREYWYNDLEMNLRQRLSKSLVMNLDYQYKLRTDQYQGYGDYAKHKLRARLKYEIDQRQLVKLDLAYWKRDYPNAFAFDTAGQSQLKYQGTKIELLYNYKWNPNSTILAQLEHWNENSSDLRYQFDRSILWAGVMWEF